MAGISVTISAVDNATGVLGRINTGFENFNRRTVSSAGQMGRFSRAVGKLGDATGVTRLASDVAGLGQKIRGVAGDLGRFTPALGALTGAASIAGIAHLVESWTAFGSRLGFDGQRIGIAAQNLQGLQGAARLAGSSAEALTGGLTHLQDGLTNAAAGRDPQMVQTLAALGISLFDVTGHARRAEQVLPELADRIAGITDPSKQALAATLAFGAAGENLLPFLRRGAAGIADYNAQAARYGLLNDRGVVAANAMREAQTRLGMAVEGVGYSISERVAPVLVPMLLQFSDWIAGHRDDISRFFVSVAESLDRWVSMGSIEKFIERMGAVGEALKRVVKFAQDVGAAFRVAFDFSLAKIERLHQLIRSVRETLGFSNDQDQPSISDPQAGLLNGRLLDSLPPSMQRLLRPVDPGITTSERIHAGMLMGPSAPDVSSAEQRNRARRGRDLLTSLGWSPEQAAGIIGNLQQESKFNEGAIGDGGAAYGIAQWHADRRSRIEQGMGRRVIGSSYEDQIRMIDWELRHNESSAGQRLQGARTAAEAGSIVSQYYERPAAAATEAAMRAQVAQAWQERWRMENGQFQPNGNAPNGVPRPGPAFGPQVVPPLAPPVAPVPAPTAGAEGRAGTEGRSTLKISFENPPPGMRTKAVSVAGLRIEQPTLGNVA